MTRWKNIDQALEFGNPEPAETYSSSKNLFEDLGIAAGTKGRVQATKRPDGWKPGDDEKPRSGGAGRGGQNRGGSRGGSTGGNSSNRSGDNRGGRSGSANPGRAGGHAGEKHEDGGVDRQKSSNDQARSTHGGGEHARPTGERNRQRRRTRGGAGGPAQG